MKKPGADPAMSAPPPVFILAAPFSGASKLAALLGGHPRLCAVPELSLFMAERVDQLRYIFEISRDVRADGLYRAIAQLCFGAQDEDGVACAQRWLETRAPHRVGRVLAELAEAAALRSLIVPDTETALRPGDLRRLAEQVPGVRVLHLVRHPHAQGCAFAPWLRERLFVPPDFKDHSENPPVIDPQIPWLRVNRNLEDFAATLAPRDYLRVRSEDLEQGAGLIGICEWIGVAAGDAELASMRQIRAWAFADYGPETAPRGLEADFLGEAPPALSAGAARLEGELPWRETPVEFTSEVRAYAAECGYR